MQKKPLLGAALCTLALIGLNTAPAFAAQPDDVPRGQVEQGPQNANSICSFSGLNDGYEPGSDDPEEVRTQSYGQLVKAGLKAEEPSPGVACNGHLMPWPEAFGPSAP